MTLEDELCEICGRFFEKQGNRDASPEEIAQFFSRCMKRGEKVQITNEVRYYIPLLASYKDGIFCTLLESGIDGISPMHYVPDLQFSLPHEPHAPKSARTSRNPRQSSRRIPQSARGLDLPVPELTTLHHRELPLTARTRTFKNTLISTRKPLPPLTETQDDVIPTLYGSVVKNNFFMGKRVDEESLDVKILPPAYPKHLIGDNFAMLSVSGVVTASGEHAGVVDLGQFVMDMANEFVVERQEFRLRYSYRMFYTWRERCRERQFRKIITEFDRPQAVAFPGFAKLIDDIRYSVLTATENFVVYPREFDSRMEEVEFEELQDVASDSILRIDAKISEVCDETGRKIAEFFKQVRAANLLMQLDFEELHSLNALPPSLQPFASDLKWKVPSIWRQRLREQQLRRERKLAGLRQEYISTFFTKVKSVYTGLLVLQCERVIRNYLERFSQKCSFKKRVNKIRSEFDPEHGIKTKPTRDTFMKWVNRTVAEITKAFLGEKKQLSLDLITEIDPEYDFKVENPIALLDRFSQLQKMSHDAMASLDQSFSFFDFELQQHNGFMKNLIDKVNEASLFTDLRDVEQLEQTVQGLVKAQESLMKRPKNVFHRNQINDELTDFVIDMRPTLEAASQFLQSGMKEVRTRVGNELNDKLFTEIQEKWASVKDKRITKGECRYIEMRMVMYSVMCDTICSAWPEAIPELKASFDTIMRIYRDLTGKTHFTHVDAIVSFNNAAEKLGISSIPIPDDDEYEEYEEEEEEEEKKEAEVVRDDVGTTTEAVVNEQEQEQEQEPPVVAEEGEKAEEEQSQAE